MVPQSVHRGLVLENGNKIVTSRLLSRRRFFHFVSGPVTFKREEIRFSPYVCVIENKNVGSENNRGVPTGGIDSSCSRSVNKYEEIALQLAGP